MINGFLHSSSDAHDRNRSTREAGEGGLLEKRVQTETLG
jgi:hypothetical protein